MNISPVVPFYFDSHQVRTTAIDSEPWFVAKDVCDILEVRWNGSQTLDFLEDDEKMVWKFPTVSGDKDTLIVSESGMYTLVIRSNKPQAKPFRRWVTKEVLPTIRKTGGYTIPQGDKKIFVSHAHTKTTNAPGGLDIRYTLDLGKIVANPTRRSVELLERLTGIQLTDIPIEDDSNTELIADQVRAFCRARCVYADGQRLTFAAVYQEYRSYCSQTGVLPLMAASKKRFSSLLSAAGFSAVRIGGTAYIADIRLTAGEVTQ